MVREKEEGYIVYVDTGGTFTDSIIVKPDARRGVFPGENADGDVFFVSSRGIFPPLHG